MKCQPTYEIPDFSRYYVRTRPFQVVSKHYGTVLSERQSKNRRGHTRIRMTNDAGEEKQVSRLVLAALVFHGQCPAGHVAHHSGGEWTPDTVFYLPEKQVLYERKSKLSRWECLTILDMYFDEGMTQTEITRRINRIRRQRKSAPVNEFEIWYAINRSPFSPHTKKGQHHERL